MAMYRGGFSFAAGGGGSSTKNIIAMDEVPMQGGDATLVLPEPSGGEYTYLEFLCTYFIGVAGSDINNANDNGWSFGKLVKEGSSYRSWWQVHNNVGYWNSGTNFDPLSATYTIGLVLGSAYGGGQDIYSLEYNPITRAISFAQVVVFAGRNRLPHVLEILVTGESG